MTTTSTQQTTELDPRTAIGYLIAANGNAKLAASRASAELGTTITDVQLYMVVVSEPERMHDFAQQMRLLIATKALAAFELTHTAYMSKLDNLPTKDLAKTYTDMLTSMTKMAQTAPTVMPDPFKSVLERLPQEVRDAVEFFMKEPAQTPEEGAKALPEGSAPQSNDQSKGATPSPGVTSAAAVEQLAEVAA